MVAGLIAKELGVELYRVDLSRVVSKYIGETEERLGSLFSEAAQVGAAQRISTIIDADHIIVLDDGAIVGAGTHGELLEGCATYQEIVQSQQAIEAAA